MSELQLVEVRLMGAEAQVRDAIQRMGWVLELAWDGALAPMRRGEGVRAYVQVRVPDLAELEKAMPVADRTAARPDRPDQPDTVTPLQKAVRERRRFHRERDDEDARQRRAEREREEHERQIRTEAIEHLLALGGERFVEIDSDENCQYTDDFKNAARFQGEDGKLWRVVGEQRCWTLDGEPGADPTPWLLFADGRVGQFKPPSPPLTRLDPRQDDYRGHEFVASIVPWVEPAWSISEEILAYVIVRYERRSAR